MSKIWTMSSDRQLMTPEEKIVQLGFTVPEPFDPSSMGLAFLPVTSVGNLLYISGQVSSNNITGENVKGKVGKDLSEEEGYKAAQICALCCIGCMKKTLGDLNKVLRIVKVTGFVNSDPGFTRQPWVVNGASELLANVFGEKGKHARTAIGVASLPLDFAVEVEMIVEVKQ